MEAERTSQLEILLITQQYAFLGHSNSFLWSFQYSFKGNHCLDKFFRWLARMSLVYYISIPFLFILEMIPLGF